MLRRFCRVVRLVASLVLTTSVQADDLEITIRQITSADGHLMIQVLTEAAFKGEASASESARLASGRRAGRTSSSRSTVVIRSLSI